LGRALNALAIAAGRAGEEWGAVAAARELVTVYRHVAELDPARSPSLADALNNLAATLGPAGDPAAASGPAEEAVALWRQAVAIDARHLPALARALTNLAGARSGSGDHARAVPAAQESVTVFRRLAGDRDPVALAGLAKSLTALGITLAQTGDHARSADVTREAVDISRGMAKEDPARFLPDLGLGLTNLADRLTRAGQPRLALAAAREAAAVYDRLTAANPAFLAFRASALTSLASGLSQAGDPEEALKAAEEAVDRYRELAAANPDTFRGGLARALANLASRLAETNDRARALATAEEAADLHLRLAEEDPGTFLDDLSGSLWVLASRRWECGDRDGALAAFATSREADRAPVAFRLATRAAWRAAMNDLSGASDDLVAAAWLIDGAAASVVTGRALEHIRTTSRDLDGRFHETARLAGRVPTWVLQPIGEDVVSLVREWSATSAWDDRERVLTRHLPATLAATRRAELDLLALLHPNDPGPREICAILDAAGRGGIVAVLDQRRDAATFEQDFAGWLAAPTWADSRDFLAAHPGLPGDPRTRARLEELAAADPTATRLLAILNLLKGGDIADVYDIVLDIAVASDETMTAVGDGDAEALANLTATAPALLHAPFVGPFLAGARALLADDHETAIDQSAVAATQATAVQRGAAVARLRRLRAARPDLTLPIDTMIESLSPGPVNIPAQPASAPPSEAAQALPDHAPGLESQVAAFPTPVRAFYDLIVKAESSLSQGQPDAALICAAQALGVVESAYGRVHFTVCPALYTMIRSLQALNRAEEALPLARRLAAVAEAVTGGTVPDLAGAVSLLGLVQRDLGQYEEALTTFQRALALAEDAGGAFVATTLNNLGAVLLDLDRADEALPVLRRSLAIVDETLGSDDPLGQKIREKLARASSAVELSRPPQDRDRWEDAGNHVLEAAQRLAQTVLREYRTRRRQRP